MSTEHECKPAASPLNDAQRDAWLELGGFIGAADGLSALEIDALVASAAGPEGDGVVLRQAIERGAGSVTLPTSALALAEACKPFIRLQCLSEIFHATGADGCSEPEWKRLGEVASALLGDAKGPIFVDLCRAEETVGKLRRALMES